MASETEPKRRFRSRTRDLVERRISLVRLVIAIFVARIAVTVVEVSESNVSFWSALITLAIAIEAWRAWMVWRIAKREHLEPAPVPDSGWDRFLRPLERSGPAIIYGLTAAFVVAVLIVVALGNSRDTLLDVAVVGREITTFFFLAVVLAGYMSVRQPKGEVDADT
ncbi:MAG TPA: hypothetical protein VGI73_06325 [Solirubrobacterales bacterium]